MLDLVVANNTVGTLQVYRGRGDGTFAFVAPDQINFLVPAGTSVGPAVLTVIRDGAAIAQSATVVSLAAPTFFMANGDRKGVPAAQALHVKSGGTRTTEYVLVRESPGQLLAASD